MYDIRDDQKMVFDLLQQEKLLLVQGTGFNWPAPDHFRLAFLPREEELEDAIGRLARFLKNYKQ
ncbi:Glutamate-pyruvate aminotransferase AlaA [compost metagenome]